MRVRGLYTIVDRVGLARTYLEGGARIVQLRDKRRSESEKALNDFLRAARALSELKKTYDFLFIVNDDAEIARDVGADGVHVGKDDPPIATCRKILGPGKIIGYSSHDLEEAVAAERSGADYVAFGAIFPTPTKGPGHPVQGLERLRQVIQAVKIPVVAIGGIGQGNINDVLATGADCVAMISALAKAENRIKEVQWFSRLFEE